MEREADPHNLAPTASAITALALGHALAIALMCARHFTAEEFGRFHPGGQLGRNLRHQGAGGDARRRRSRVRGAPSFAQRRDYRYDRSGRWAPPAWWRPMAALAGFITDGDLRRALTITTISAAFAPTM